MGVDSIAMEADEVLRVEDGARCGRAPCPGGKAPNQRKMLFPESDGKLLSHIRLLP